MARWPWFLFTLILFAGALTSPLTAAKVIEVRGSHTSDRARVQSILATLQGVPWRSVNRDLLESRLKQNPEIEDIQFENNMFGRGIVTIKPRKPVALLVNKQGLAIDRYGQIFETKSKHSALAKLQIDPVSLGNSSSISHGVDLKGAAELASLITELVPNYAISIEMDARSAFYLRVGTGVRIVLGSSDKLEAKVKRLADILAMKPDLRYASEINLIVPNQPVYTP